jgi:hypothetical protein
MRVRVRAVPRALAASGGLALVFVALLAACGDRSALFPDEPGDAGATDGSHARPDVAGPDVRPEAVPDVPSDVAPDARADAVAFDCPDAGDVPIYVLSHASETELMLYSFAPRTSAFSSIGKLSCVTNFDPVLVSMAIDRAGTAYVYDEVHGLYQVDTATAKCGLAYGFAGTLGLAFMQQGDGPGETLFALEEPGSVRTSRLGTIDQTAWTFVPIAPIAWGSVMIPHQVELAGTSGGKLFALLLYDETGTDLPQRLAQIDAMTGQVLSSLDVRGAFPAAFDSGGFAPWGSDFYFFDSYGNVTRYARTMVTTLPGANFVAAATSGCGLQ